MPDEFAELRDIAANMSSRTVVVRTEQLRELLAAYDRVVRARDITNDERAALERLRADDYDSIKCRGNLDIDRMLVSKAMLRLFPADTTSAIAALLKEPTDA